MMLKNQRQPKRKLKKKAAIEIQFNWIFVLIIGAVILAVFITFVLKQKNVAEQKQHEEILSQLDLILTGSKVSRGSAIFIETPNKVFEFKCSLSTCNDYTCLSTLSIKDSEMQGTSYSVQPVFSPDYIQGGAVTSWTIDWQMPYSIINFLYLTSPHVKYVIIEQGTDPQKKFATDLYDAMPDKTIVTQNKEERTLFNKDKVASPTSSSFSEGNYKVRLIFVETGPTLSGPIAGNPEISAIKIMPQDSGKSLDGYGKITFYKWTGSGFSAGITTDYLGKASLFGAVFAEDAAQYNCNMKKAFNAMKLVTDVYIRRATDLSGFYSAQTNSICSLTYTLPGSPPDQLLYRLSQIKTKSADGLSNSGGIFNDVDKVTQHNSDLSKNSCILLY